MLILCILFIMSQNSVSAQAQRPYVRIAKIEIDPTRLELYKAALKEGAETAVRVEPGVISLYGVYDKGKPTSVTVFEIYASKEAYASHVLTPHFLKYKAATQNMVTSLRLTDVVPIVLSAKQERK